MGVTRGWLPQIAGSPSLNGGEDAATVLAHLENAHVLHYNKHQSVL